MVNFMFREGNIPNQWNFIKNNKIIVSKKMKYFKIELILLIIVLIIIVSKKMKYSKIELILRKNKFL